MKKKTVIILIVTLMLVFLTPIRQNLKDGGSVCYKALLYEVTKIHRLNFVEAEDVTTQFINGIEIKILGMKVYENTWTKE